jgi:peroxiredoxin
VAFSPQVESYGRSIHRRANLGYDILTDHRLRICAQFGLVFELPDYLREVFIYYKNFLPESHDDDGYRLPMPARYIIDQQSVLRSVDVNVDYRIRPEPSETVRELEELIRGKG